MPDVKRQRIELLQGSLVYRDDRLKGCDAAAVIEVIEHMEAGRLPAFEAAIFGHVCFRLSMSGSRRFATGPDLITQGLVAGIGARQSRDEGCHLSLA